VNDVRLQRLPQPRPQGSWAALPGVIWRLRTRLLLAALNGFLAFLFGLGVQTVLLRFAGVSHFTAYVVQNVFSTQLSFLLAKYVTWRDRRVPFLLSLGRYNLQQLTTVLLGIVLFAALDAIGLNYIVASLTVTIAIAPLSFLIAHNWSICERRSAEINRWPKDAVATGRSAA
jgi:putative flippase GtrA